MDKLRIGFVIPCLNEEKTIYQIIKNIKQYGCVIVVDDGSIDKSSKIAGQAGAIVVEHIENLGYEAALNTGFKKASQLGVDAVITLDADGQHDPNLIPLFLQQLEQGNDLVLGVRNKVPRLSERLFAFYSHLKCGIKDPLCGMKAYRMNVYNDLGFFDSYQSVGSELAFYGALKQYKVVQIDFIVKDRQDNSRYGQVFQANFRILVALFKTIYHFRGYHSSL